ncbi:MAG: endonuclease/exonuclease/phosphatase family protein [Alphaproteobacteria bacterium]|nr:endonuclease/exonuclease/phosphatase family protein [Alphaproteobacteria bacterium]
MTQTGAVGLVTRTLPRLDWPSLAERERIHAGPVTPEAFRAAFARLQALHAVETAASAVQAAPKDRLRVVFWNAERLKYLAPSIRLLGGLGADLLLLCEVDLGMARSGNRHTVAELGKALGHGYLFATEFVELDLGDARERAWHKGESNLAGLHGAAILSRLPLRRPALIRLETSGRWFDGVFGERRVGGRSALACEVEIAGEPVLMVSVHYESHTDAADRLLSTKVLLDTIDAHAPERPVLIGGDFNTSTFTLAEKRDLDLQARALAADPDRFLDPTRYEPMFRHLSERGYDWTRCNVLGAATQRTRPDGTPPPPFGRIDWLFSRGLEAAEPAVIAAVDANGVAISDHEALAVTIRPRR